MLERCLFGSLSQNPWIFIITSVNVQKWGGGGMVISGTQRVWSTSKIQSDQTHLVRVVMGHRMHYIKEFAIDPCIYRCNRPKGGFLEHTRLCKHTGWYNQQMDYFCVLSYWHKVFSLPWHSCMLCAVCFIIHFWSFQLQNGKNHVFSYEIGNSSKKKAAWTPFLKHIALIDIF